LEALEREDLSRVKLLWLNYPHMPTGTPAQAAVFQQLIAFARRHQILLVNDNPYSFILNDQPLSILSQEGAMEVAIELNSMSKSFNMAGWRIGSLCGRADYLDTVLKFKSNMDSGMFKPAQLAAVQALQLEGDWFEQLNAVYQARKMKAVGLLRSIGCTVADGQVGMFVWAKVPQQYKDGYAFSDEWLYETHVFLTPGGIFGTQGDAYVRLSLCSSEAVLEEAQRRIGAHQKVLD
ncbi:MAG: aminotransferase class I/II-fold pyridoxal phosphate-dependent enzyme, partial [Phaeodactylibacter sp.]|nr:aminotransferase class I/II-fold pyridoxal phosphate-dependent enzyme [Phaeodactylibacter sp.]